MSKPHLSKLGFEKNNLVIRVLPGQMQLFLSGRTKVVRNIPEGYVVMEMYKSSRNSFEPSHPGVYIGGENYWPVKIKHQFTGRMKWVNLHEDEPTVRAFVKETMAMEK